MPNRSWTAATLYKRLRELLLEEGVDIDATDGSTENVTLSEIRDKLKARIVEDAMK